MKSIILEYIKTGLILFGIELVLFVLMIFFSMTDESLGFFGRLFGWIFKYVIGFPLVLFNKDFPFFLESTNPPNYMILMVILNLLIQITLIVFIRKLLKM